jgi:hypothetical protein
MPITEKATAMSVLFLDFETFYGDDYTLKKLTPPEYVLDPRYETIGCSAAVDGEPAHWVDGPDFAHYLSQFDPAKTTTVTFNALFDNCILAWVYGFVPARMYCSMRMAAALRGHILPGVSLSVVARVLGLGEKGTEIHNVKGMRRSEIMNDPVLWHSFQRYANNDNELSRKIFATLLPEFPHSERKIMDHVIRCAVEPTFLIDVPMLQQHLADLDNERAENLIEAMGPNPTTSMTDPHREEKLEEFAKTLRSNDQFTKVLQDRGIDIALKPSATDPERQIPAFAKTDEFMADLQENEDPVVQALAIARLGLRSTIEKSRGEKILSIATLPWACYRDGNPRLYSGGTMPIPLRYSGAHTHRLSGEWRINMQNLPAGRGKRKSKLRKALVAPPGYKVLVADLAQIECRIAAWLCGETDLIDQFATKKDPYSILATKIFGFIVDKKVHLLERFIGKSGVLGLGFGCGADKFFNMVLRAARGMGMDMGPLLAVWTPQLAQKSVDTYREANRAIKASWYRLGEILDTAWCGATGPVMWGPTSPVAPNGCVEIGHGYVLMPNGMKLLYDVLPKGDDGHRYRYGKKTYRMYGPKFLENIVQALARIVVMNASLRLWDRGYKFRLQAHDELAFIVRDDDAENAKAIVLEEMRRRPSWAPDLPLDAEANYGQSYGDAK